MATYREVASMIQDIVHAQSDDSNFTTEHIIFLMCKQRAYILAQQYNSLKKPVPDANYQQICVTLKNTNNDDFCGENFLVSNEKVPDLMPYSKTTVYPPAGYPYGNINMVNNTKFIYAGNSMFAGNAIYATIGPDERLYIKANGNSYTYIDKVILHGVFNSPESASLLECNPNGNIDNCDVLDKEFPLEDAFIGLLIDVVMNELIQSQRLPSDDVNNSHDDLNSVIRQYSNRNSQDAQQ